MMYMLSQIPAVVNSGRTRSTTQKVASPSDFCVVRANGRICPHADKSGRVIVEDLLRVTAIREARFARRVGILPLPVGGGGGGGGEFRRVPHGANSERLPHGLASLSGLPRQGGDLLRIFAQSERIVGFVHVRTNPGS
jgi:hypothetical protein